VVRHWNWAKMATLLRWLSQMSCLVHNSLAISGTDKHWRYLPRPIFQAWFQGISPEFGRIYFAIHWCGASYCGRRRGCQLAAINTQFSNLLRDAVAQAVGTTSTAPVPSVFGEVGSSEGWFTTSDNASLQVYLCAECFMHPAQQGSLRCAWCRLADDEGDAETAKGRPGSSTD
jgi:hypothetical protein